MSRESEAREEAAIVFASNYGLTSKKEGGRFFRILSENECSADEPVKVLTVDPEDLDIPTDFSLFECGCGLLPVRMYRHRVYLDGDAFDFEMVSCSVSPSDYEKFSSGLMPLFKGWSFGEEIETRDMSFAENLELASSNLGIPKVDPSEARLMLARLLGVDAVGLKLLERGIGAPGPNQSKMVERLISVENLQRCASSCDTVLLGSVFDMIADEGMSLKEVERRFCSLAGL